MVKNKSKNPVFFIHCVCVHAQSCLTLCNSMDCSPPASSVHGIFQARILEWVAITSSRGSFQPRNQTCIFYTGRQILHHCTTWEALSYIIGRENQELEPDKTILTVVMIGYVNSDVSSVIYYENNHLLYFHTN